MEILREKKKNSRLLLFLLFVLLLLFFHFLLLLLLLLFSFRNFSWNFFQVSFVPGGLSFSHDYNQHTIDILTKKRLRKIINNDITQFFFHVTCPFFPRQPYPKCTLPSSLPLSLSFSSRDCVLHFFPISFSSSIFFFSFIAFFYRRQSQI